MKALIDNCLVCVVPHRLSDSEYIRSGNSKNSVAGVVFNHDSVRKAHGDIAYIVLHTEHTGKGIALWVEEGIEPASFVTIEAESVARNISG